MLNLIGEVGASPGPRLAPVAWSLLLFQKRRLRSVVCLNLIALENSDIETVVDHVDGAGLSVLWLVDID